MKKFFLHTLFGVLTFVNMVFGVDFPKTYTAFSCSNCTPPGYTIVSGGPTALSNMTGVGGSPVKPWIDNFLPPPSSGKAIDGNSNNVFLTLRHSTVQKDKVKASVGGFEVGNKYTLHYYVMTARADLSLGTSDYAASATVDVQTSNLTSVASKTTTFSVGVNVNKWVEETVTFVAPATDLVFYLSGMSNPQQTAYVNFDIYSKPFDCVVPGGQVTLFHGGTLTTPFSCATTNLYDLVQGSAPAGATPVWGINPNSSYPQLTEEEAKAAGVKPSGQYYYAFYKTPGGCYNTDISTAKASFTATPTQVSLTSHEASINCINQTGINLTAQIAPTNYKVLWFTNDKHQGLPVENSLTARVNTYYAFYFDAKNNCYSVDKADATAIFSVVGSTMCCNDPNDPSNQIPLLNTDVKIVAPAQTYDLTKLIPANLSIPPNTVIEWYTNASHAGSPIADPKHAGPGKYYVFAHDLSNGCFNVPFSKSSVNVAKNAPQLAVRVALQGPFKYGDGEIMRNDLQVYGNTGLLPTTTPYGGSEVCTDINDYSKMSSVIDWINVEIRDAANPSILLESKSLVLKSSGAIVNVDGTSYPYFKTQSNPVRIIVKHRNHLAIMSNPIQNFGPGVVSYDFTTALSQASNEFGDPVQMIQVNGIWCMQLGDLTVSQDLAIDGADGTDFKVQFKAGVFDAYNRADTNMDGVVDGLDGSLFKINFLLGLYSSIINY